MVQLLPQPKGELKGQAYTQAPMLGAKGKRLKGKQAAARPTYLLPGESLDAIGDMLYNKQLLKKHRFRSSTVPNVATSAALGRQANTQLLDQHGLLPTEVTKKRVQGKQAAKPYK